MSNSFRLSRSSPSWTADLCDAYTDPVESNLRWLPLPFRNLGRIRRFHGRITTIACDDTNMDIHAVLRTPGHAGVLVVAAGGAGGALIGGNLAATAQRNEWSGIVVDGRVRDVDELGEIPIGIRATSISPLPCRRSGDSIVGGVVSIGGRLLRDGDWLLADPDGIVVVAQEPDWTD